MANILHVAVVIVGPKAAAGFSVDQARADSKTLTVLADAAFDDRANVESPRYFSCGQAGALESKGRSPRNDVEAAEPAESHDHFFSHAIAEELVASIGAHVVTGEHCEGTFSGGCGLRLHHDFSGSIISRLHQGARKQDDRREHQRSCRHQSQRPDTNARSAPSGDEVTAIGAGCQRRIPSGAARRFSGDGRHCNHEVRRSAVNLLGKAAHVGVGRCAELSLEQSRMECRSLQGASPVP